MLGLQLTDINKQMLVRVFDVCRNGFGSLEHYIHSSYRYEYDNNNYNCGGS